MTGTNEFRKGGTAAMAGVLERFPEYRSSLERLWSIDADFQNLCEEYQDCADAFRYWKESPADEASSRRSEYEVLLRDLEEEILCYLEKSDQRLSARRL